MLLDCQKLPEYHFWILVAFNSFHKSDFQLLPHTLSVFPKTQTVLSNPEIYQLEFKGKILLRSDLHFFKCHCRLLR
jgi:hypothetical protein